MNTPVAVRGEGETAPGAAPTEMSTYLDVRDRLARGDKSIPPALFVDAVMEGLAFAGDWPVEGEEVCGCHA